MRNMIAGTSVGKPRGRLRAIDSIVGCSLLARADSGRVSVRALGRNMPDATPVAGTIHRVL